MRNCGFHIRFTAGRRFRLLRLAAGAWLLSLAGCFGGCDYDRFDPPEPHPADVPVPTMSIATLRSLYKGDPVSVTGKRSVVVSGNVTTSDREGNFFRSFFIEDETGAVEIRAGLYDLHAVYRLGQQVTVVADSLTLGLTGGVLQLGLASSAYETDYMGHRVVVDRHVFRNERFETVTPRPVTPARLDDEWLGTLVRFDGMRLSRYDLGAPCFVVAVGNTAKRQSQVPLFAVRFDLRLYERLCQFCGRSRADRSGVAYRYPDAGQSWRADRLSGQIKGFAGCGTVGVIRCC